MLCPGFGWRAGISGVPGFVDPSAWCPLHPDLAFSPCTDVSKCPLLIGSGPPIWPRLNLTLPPNKVPFWGIGSWNLNMSLWWGHNSTYYRGWWTFLIIKRMGLLRINTMRATCSQVSSSWTFFHLLVCILSIALCVSVIYFYQSYNCQFVLNSGNSSTSNFTFLDS